MELLSTNLPIAIEHNTFLSHQGAWLKWLAVTMIVVRLDLPFY